VDPSKKVLDLNCEVQDLLLEVVISNEMPDLRSGGIPHNLTPVYHSRQSPSHSCCKHALRATSQQRVLCNSRYYD